MHKLTDARPTHTLTMKNYNRRNPKIFKNQKKTQPTKFHQHFVFILYWPTWDQGSIEIKNRIVLFIISLIIYSIIYFLENLFKSKRSALFSIISKTSKQTLAKSTERFCPSQQTINFMVSPQAIA